jgi:hypothetical protein
MKTLFRADDALQESFLALSWHDLISPIYVTLVFGKITAQHIHETVEREILVLVQVKELWLEDGVVVLV